MANLPLVQRGPFKVAHFSAIFYLFVQHAVPVLPLGRQSYGVGIDLGFNKYGSRYTKVFWPSAIMWHRKSAFAVRAPFRLWGMWCYKAEHSVFSFVLTGSLAYWADRGRFSLSEVFAEIDRAPWIYYSGNISNGPVCQ